MKLEELYDLAEALDVDVEAFSFGAREALSVQFGQDDYLIALDPFRLKSNADEKTKLAHELGHCATGAFYNQYSTHDVRARHELRADKWAIRRLIPKDELDAAVADGYTKPWELAEHFGVTEDFMRKAIHWYQCGNLAVI